MKLKHLVLLPITAAILICTPRFVFSQEAASVYAIPETDEGLAGEGVIRRYDWFLNLWERKRTGWAKDVKKDQGAVVFFGDSITQGWGATMKNSFGDMKVANRGISGDTTRGMLARIKGDVLDVNPRAVVMLFGTNDLEEKMEPEPIAANLKLIIAELKKHNPDMPLVLCQIFPSHASKARPADKIKKTNKLFAEAVKGDPQVIVLDTWTLFADAEGNAQKPEFPDLLHPNNLGYDKWASALKPIFATLGFLETEADTFTSEEGFEPLFNGKDLTGWGYRAKKTMVPTETFDGKTKSSENRYQAINHRLVVTTPPEGRALAQLWTTKEFGNDFTLKLEFRGTPNADSGVFLRKPQLQCRDYALAGPYKTLKKYKPQDWNELVVVVKDNVAHCTCNGEVLEEAMELPESGPIGLEGDRGQIEYRRIRIKTSGK
jgi:lysophospholipase L1-like esterase